MFALIGRETAKFVKRTTFWSFALLSQWYNKGRKRPALIIYKKKNSNRMVLCHWCIFWLKNEEHFLEESTRYSLRDTHLLNPVTLSLNFF